MSRKRLGRGTPFRLWPGTGHFHQLAVEPRPAGGAGEARARDYAAGILRDAGFDVRSQPFAYSAFPGRFATPVGGAVGALSVLGAASLGLTSLVAWHAAAALATGLVTLGLFVRGMLGDAVLDLPYSRAESVNLVATRGAAAPSVWLVAHLDSKSQPVPSAVRVAGVLLLVAAIIVALLCSVGGALQLAPTVVRTGWWGAALLAAAGAPAVIASVVGARSDGAVDNASGVATVLEAAVRVRPSASFGVLLPSAEELGLAGARAFAREWTRARGAGTAINCDGVDDEGAMTIMFSGRKPAALLATIQGAASEAVRERRLPLGLLTDAVAFADRGWATATLSRGGWNTLRRIHTSADSLRACRGTGIDAAATLLARAVEALT